MLLIECPFCGSRAEIEFAYGGPAQPSPLPCPMPNGSIG